MQANDDELLETVVTRFQSAKLATAAAQTQRLYRIGFAQFDAYLARPAMVADMRDETIAPWLAWLRDVRQLDPITVNGRRSKMLTFWRWGCRKHYFPNWPEVPKLTEPEKIPRGWKINEIRALLAAAALEQGSIAGIPAPDYWRALFYFWFHGGERSGATLRIRFDDVNWDTGEIDAPGAIRKAGKAERHQMGMSALKAISKICRPRRVLLFPWPYHMTTLYNHVRRICLRAKLPYRPPKAWRISFASYLEAGGGNATAALQHTSRSITVRHYLDPAIVKRPRAADRLPKV